MIRAVLLTVDGSAPARAAAAYAVSLCRRLRGRLAALYVVDRRLFHMVYGEEYMPPGVPTNPYFGELEERLEAQGQALLASVERQAAEVGVPCRTELRSGLPDVEIMKAARGCDLIVLGRHGESAGLRKRWRLGAVAERVVRGAHQPILVAGERFFAISRVLLGYDGSRRAHAVLVYAAELAARLDLPLLAVSVCDDMKLAEGRLEAVLRYSESHRAQLTARALRGDPVKGILGEAQEGDLIAMGAFGHGRVRAWLLGSTTEAVLGEAVQPILLHR